MRTGEVRALERNASEDEPPADASPEHARTLDSASRLELLTDFVTGGNAATGAICKGHPELRGLYQFQRWLTQSGRIAEGAGSAWWSEVNGRILLDMVESSAQEPTPDIGLSESSQAWRHYWQASTGENRTRLCWSAHQTSLKAGALTAVDVLALEPPAEQEFITMALSCVEVAALANLPTGRMGSRVVSTFCRLCYPARYPACDGSGTGSHSVRIRAASFRNAVLQRLARWIQSRFVQ